MDLELVRKALAQTKKTMSWETLKEEIDAHSEIPD